VIIASTHPGRAGFSIGQWSTERAQAHGAFDVVVAYLAELDLPLMDEPNHSAYTAISTSAPKTGAPPSKPSDAFAIVTPNTILATRASIKNAFDYQHGE
jgi:NAD(P)H-dependent FMN reductase